MLLNRPLRPVNSSRGRVQVLFNCGWVLEEVEVEVEELSTERRLALLTREEQTPPTTDSPRKGKAVYEGLGLRRAATPAASTGSGSRAGEKGVTLMLRNHVLDGSHSLACLAISDRPKEIGLVLPSYLLYLHPLVNYPSEYPLRLQRQTSIRLCT